MSELHTLINVLDKPMKAHDLAKVVPHLHLLSAQELDKMLRLIIEERKLQYSMSLVAKILEQLLKLKAVPYSVIEQFAGVFVEHGALLELISLHHVYLYNFSKDSNARFNLAYYQAKANLTDEAIDEYKACLKQQINDSEEVHLNIALLYSERLGDVANAEYHLNQALQLEPNYLAALLNKANLAVAKGDFESATSIYISIIGDGFENQTISQERISPEFLIALSRLLPIVKAPKQCALVKYSKEVLKAIGSTKLGAQIDLELSIAHVYDANKQFEEAYKFIHSSNLKLTKITPLYDRTLIEKLIVAIKNNTFLNERKHQYHDDGPHKLLFICGMFRSGSTLLEKIMSAHSNVESRGETSFYPNLFGNRVENYLSKIPYIDESDIQQYMLQHKKYIQPSNKSVTIDKRPDNILYMPIIKAMYPSAKIIVTDRDIRDTALSLLLQHLGPTFNYANNIENINHYYNQLNVLVQFYQERYKDDIIVVKYEDVIVDFKQTIEACLGFVGLEWESQCEEFYLNKELSYTASMEQVRKPLYHSSLGRYKHYEGLIF